MGFREDNEGLTLGFATAVGAYVGSSEGLRDDTGAAITGALVGKEVMGSKSGTLQTHFP